MDEDESDGEITDVEEIDVDPIMEGKVKYSVKTAKVLAPHDRNVIARHLVLRHGGGETHAPGQVHQECLLAAALTDHNIKIYTGNHLIEIATLKGHTKTITGLKFSDSDMNRLYSCSEDGTLKVWDLRQNVQVGELRGRTFHFDRSKGVVIFSLVPADDSDVSPKPFCSFDVSPDDTYACCGTELIREDAFLLFWDLRAVRLLGGYWESHGDDITGVRFNPEEPNLIASGSTDGLINTFDITQSTEDDALLHTMNTESSADAIAWYSSSNVACLTHNETVQLWDAKEACQLASFSRNDVAALFQIPSTIFVSFSSSRTGMLGVVATSRKGQVFLLDVDCSKTFVNHGILSVEAPILTAHWDTESDCVVTCDEGGLLCFWQSGA